MGNLIETVLDKLAMTIVLQILPQYLYVFVTIGSTVLVKEALKNVLFQTMGIYDSEKLAK